MIFGTWIKGLAGMIANRVELATTPPVPEGVSAATGAGSRAARNDHVHQRLTSTQWDTLNAAGEATFTFTRSFSKEPGISSTVRQSSGMPMLWQVKSWITDAQGNYIGCTLKYFRMQLLPANLTVLLSLQNFDVSAGTSLSGMPVCCIAIQQSQ